MMLDVCTICHQPAIGGFNVNLSAASSVPSRFERRCANHGGKMPGTMTMNDQHQPAAVAPRLSEDELNGIIENLAINCALNEQDGVDLLRELDATRADLARTRAEAAALKKAIEYVLVADDKRWASYSGKYGRPMNVDTLRGAFEEALAAPQSEQQPQPAAPVARSAEASEPAWVRRGVGDLNGRSQRYVTCLDCGWLTYTDSPTIVDHTTDCPHATMPPDHQAAGDSDG